MFYNRNINTKINNLHFRALRMVYQDNTSSFEDLSKDGSVTVHHRNIQSLAIEMFKVGTGNHAATFHKKIRVLLLTTANARAKSIFYNNVNPRTTRYGLEILRTFGHKIWTMIPINLRSIEYLAVFEIEIKKWISNIFLVSYVRNSFLIC